MDSIWRRTFSEARRSSQRWRTTTRMPKRAVRANMAASNFQKRCSSITVERQLGGDMVERGGLSVLIKHWFYLNVIINFISLSSVHCNWCEIVYREKVSLCWTTDWSIFPHRGSLTASLSHLLWSSLLDLVQLTRSTYPVGLHADHVLWNTKQHMLLSWQPSAVYKSLSVIGHVQSGRQYTADTLWSPRTPPVSSRGRLLLSLLLQGEKKKKKKVRLTRKRQHLNSSVGFHFPSSCCRLSSCRTWSLLVAQQSRSEHSETQRNISAHGQDGLHRLFTSTANKQHQVNNLE